ncbi:hypothetical protein P171DRAFT_446420 [Karstenula rhodostoma CBS 690.94]|uniref:Uncharacterized protein n=1 Tax=Karstenula rhodostoma CBS 690.94 TaxID=1392251 RepID=A0A9P4PCS5_9PLEO|nr:hypothetical protein P171DRAFT_446420 [Karstenula rhodostoma CBS 690.94]
MVLIKKICAPQDVQATLTVRLTTASPTVSLSSLRTSSSEPILEFHIYIRCNSSKQPTRPITISTQGTIFDDSHRPEDGHMDNLALGMLGGGLTCATEAGLKRISFGYFKIHRARQDNGNALDLRDRPDAAFLTIPAQDTGDEVVVKHTLTSERLFAYADGRNVDDLLVGERYKAHLSDGYVGATWWRWGGLEDELKNKKLHPSTKKTIGRWGGEESDIGKLEKKGWVFGENRAQLVFEVEEGGGSCEIGIIE